MSSKRLCLILVLLVVAVFATSAQAHQLVLTTGYAASGAPKTGSGIDASNPPFTSGGGYAAGVRVDVYSVTRPIWFSPSFLFWDNLTGATTAAVRVNYLQIEFGARLSVHTRSIPMFYAGAGAGYSFSHGVEHNRAVGAESPSFDGDFPTASIHAGVKTPTSTTGIAFLAETSYHFGLANASGYQAIGPAHAWLIQIGVAFDLVSQGE